MVYPDFQSFCQTTNISITNVEHYAFDTRDRIPYTLTVKTKFLSVNNFGVGYFD